MGTIKSLIGEAAKAGSLSGFVDAGVKSPIVFADVEYSVVGGGFRLPACADSKVLPVSVITLDSYV